MKKIWNEQEKLWNDGTPFVLVTMVNVRGSAPQELGAKMLVINTGLHAGTVGGGKIEAHCIREAMKILNEKKREPWLATWNLQKDIGMSCGGEATFLFEPQQPEAWQIIVFGAGHVAQALVRVLEPLACTLTCVDPRAEWLSRIPAKIKTSPEVEIKNLPDNAYYVVMTQGHTTDLPILEKILKEKTLAPYVGVMGSDVKAGKMRRELIALGVDANQVERLRCPIGLPFGGNEPEEIALSVAAELLQVRDRTNQPKA
jgi:xanthine dehydrogenase accessory factor